ncbi:MAG: helix-turn-helix domain-containing protein [Desulfobacterales bacterium]|nr:helix-turn-helix domain-containing protein [Desulfobacterales bacterium]
MVQFNIESPVEVAKNLSVKTKRLRLEKRWTRRTLSERSGVPESSLRRFEDTGKISLESFLKLMCALGRLDEAGELLNPPKIRSIEQLAHQTPPLPKRGTI